MTAAASHQLRFGRHLVAGGTGDRRGGATPCSSGSGHAIRRRSAATASRACVRCASRIAAQFPERSHDLSSCAAARSRRSSARPVTTESLAEEAIEVFLAERNRVEFYADVRPSLERLRARYRLFALSNGNADLAALRHRRSVRRPRHRRRRGRGQARRAHLRGARAPGRRERRAGAAHRRRSAGGCRRREHAPACRRCGSTATSRRWPGAVRAAGAHHFDARGNSLAPQ